MANKLEQIWKAKDLRNSIIFVLLMLVVFRLAAHIPIPGVNAEALRQFFGANQALGLMDLFSGGGMRNFSIVMMGVGPYITSSIIFQLLAMVVPKLEEMQKEEAGRQKISMWTRWITVPLSAIQAYSMIIILQKSVLGFMTNVSPLTMVSMITTITAGTIFLMWLGELISEKKIGNGISLMIFAGIIASMPETFRQLLATYDASMLPLVIGLIIVTIATVVGVVIVNEGQRDIPVQYARQIRGNRTFGGSTTHLPLRVNMAGVMPIIFAISILTFPSMIAYAFMQARTQYLVKASEWVISVFNNQLFYGITYFVLVVAFTYFYTEVVFKPKQVAENLQRQGGFIPGIRPGSHTEEYLSNTASKVIFVGALFLGLIAILPLILRYFSGIQSLAIGGTSILIVVSVVIETVKQIGAQLSMRQYEG